MRYLTEDTYDRTYRLLCEVTPSDMRSWRNKHNFNTFTNTGVSPRVITGPVSGWLNGNKIETYYPDLSNVPSNQQGFWWNTNPELILPYKYEYLWQIDDDSPINARKFKKTGKYYPLKPSEFTINNKGEVDVKEYALYDALQKASEQQREGIVDQFGRPLLRHFVAKVEKDPTDKKSEEKLYLTRNFAEFNRSLDPQNFALEDYKYINHKNRKTVNDIFYDVLDRLRKENPGIYDKTMYNLYGKI